MIFTKIETSSNHGTEQGIIPRFELQMIDLYRIALENPKEYELNKFVGFSNVVLPEITHFYDINLSMVQKFEVYMNGMIKGEYCKIQNGIPCFDRSIELEIKDLIKDFFIRGRILLQNFSKSQIIDDNYFCLDKLLIVNDKKFQKNKIEQQALIPDNRYDILYNLIENSRQKFLKDFNDIRGGFEHNQTITDKFDYDFEKKLVIEPTLKKMKLKYALTFFYENILDLVEKLMCYYFGIKANIRSNGGLKLFIQKDYDYKNLRYKYIISPIRFNNLIDCDYT
jgi:hypothetical protein